MGCQSAFGHVIHPLCPDLHFQRTAFLVLDGDMKGFISVGFRIGQPVAQTPGVGLIFFCHIGEYLPAESLLHVPVLLAVDDETYGEHIEDTFERHLLLLHFPVYGQCCLGTHLKLVLYSLIGELLLERLDELGHELLPVSLGALEFVGDGPVLFRIRMAEIYVLHFALYVVQPELMGQGNVQHHGLQDLSLAGKLWEHVQRTHHFQPVRNLEDGDTRVA